MTVFQGIGGKRTPIPTWAPVMGKSRIISPILRGYLWVIVPTDDIDTRDTSKKHRRTDDIAKKF